MTTGLDPKPGRDTAIAMLLEGGFEHAGDADSDHYVLRAGGCMTQVQILPPGHPEGEVRIDLTIAGGWLAAIGRLAGEEG